MRRIILAFRVFFGVLFQSATAEAVTALLEGKKPTPPEEVKKKPKTVPPAKPEAVRSEALALLATLQREARFVDFLMEPLEGYADAQIGAVARDVHRDCGKVIARLFALEPLVADEENAEVDVPAGFDPGCYRLTGNVVGEAPFRGRLAHHGWKAQKCELPTWSGKPSAARVVAPAEVELS